MHTLIIRLTTIIRTDQNAPPCLNSMEDFVNFDNVIAVIYYHKHTCILYRRINANNKIKNS